jgi:hypothetical protein
VDFIPLTTESGSIMFTMIKDEVKQEWQLSPKDRCDKCNAEALVQVTGIPGDLLFCGHHYNSIMSTPKGYKSMMSFMISVVDEREKLVENRAKGESY